MQIKQWLLGLLALATASVACAQSFTYQGFLKDGGNPANGAYDFRFMLWTQPTGGVQVGPELYVDAVSVQNGLFTVQLDFGSVWDGSDRYLEIRVRRVGQFGYWLLQPRVKITPTPYAAFALRPWQTAGSAVFYNDGNVGIGTSAPAARLSLGGGDANTKLALWQGGAAGEVMGFGIGPNQFRLHLHNPANRFSFLNAPNGSELLTILGNGNVGIGLTAPAAKLHIRDGDLRVDGGEIQSWGPITLHPDVDNSGDDIVRIVDSGGTEVMRVHSDGNVGIGTSSPQSRLHVQGDAYLTNGSTTLQILPGRLFNSTQTNAATLEIPGDGVIGVWDSLSMTGDLHVGGSQVTVGGGTDPYWSRVRIGLNDVGNSLYAGFVTAYGANGSTNAIISYLNTRHPNNGAVSVHDANGTARVLIIVDENGSGLVLSDAKFFGVPDPDDATRDIWYGVYRPWDEVLPAGDDPAKAWEARLKSIQDRQARQQTSKP